MTRALTIVGARRIPGRDPRSRAASRVALQGAADAGAAERVAAARSSPRRADRRGRSHLGASEPDGCAVSQRVRNLGDCVDALDQGLKLVRRRITVELDVVLHLARDRRVTGEVSSHPDTNAIDGEPGGARLAEEIVRDATCDREVEELSSEDQCHAIARLVRCLRLSRFGVRRLFRTPAPTLRPSAVHAVRGSFARRAHDGLDSRPPRRRGSWPTRLAFWVLVIPSSTGRLCSRLPRRVTRESSRELFASSRAAERRSCPRRADLYVGPGRDRSADAPRARRSRAGDAAGDGQPRPGAGRCRWDVQHGPEDDRIHRTSGGLRPDERGVPRLFRVAVPGAHHDHDRAGRSAVSVRDRGGGVHVSLRESRFVRASTPRHGTSRRRGITAGTTCRRTSSIRCCTGG